MKIFNYIADNKFTWYILILVISVGIAMQNVLMGENHFWGGVYTFYNNYVIFKTSFFNLVHGQNLYDYHLEKHADLYKYSPTFALFMGLFYYLPDWLGLSIWNLLNASVLLYSITTLGGFTSKKKFYLLLFVIIELVLSLQNCQSNALLAGLAILAFTSLEKGNQGTAAFYICCGIFIKIFMLAFCLLALFYPNKLRFIVFLWVWVVVFFFLPVIITGGSHLIQLYQNWFHLINNDRSNTVALYKAGDTYSIYRIIDILKLSPTSKTFLLLGGTVLLLSPLTLVKKYRSQRFRLTFFCLLLVWIVIFNHKAESPSYVISLAGIGIWCLSREKSRSVIVLLFATLLFTSLFFTDLTPHLFKDILDKALVKIAMSCLLFFVILVALFRMKEEHMTDKLPL